MSEGPSTSEKSVLLDYISKFLPLVLWQSLQHKDWAVLASSIGSLLYKMLIILSTGLLALQPTNVRHGKVAMTVRNQFNGTDAETRLATIADLPLYINHGAQNLGLSYPHGTNERYAIQSFDASDFPGKGVTTTAQVDAFEADFGCQMADLHMVE